MTRWLSDKTFEPASAAAALAAQGQRRWPEMGTEVQIVADGAERLRSAVDYQRRSAEIREKVRARFAPMLSRAGFPGSLLLRVRMRRVIARRLDRLVPRAACYLKQ